MSILIKLAFSLHKKAPLTRIDFYSISREIGHGAFGKVYLGLHKLTGLKVAIKVIERSRLKDERARGKVVREVTIFRSVHHINIVTLFEVFEDDQAFYIVMEYCAGGDLLNFVRNKGRCCELEAREIFRQLVEGVASVHEGLVLHRDLKLENILIDTRLQTVKLCDFGISRMIELGAVIREQCGTPAYLAPEVLYEEGYSGFASDVWSLGVILYAMCVGRMPYKGKSLEDLKAVVRTTPLSFPEFLSASLKDLLIQMLSLDPHTRISIGQILTHSWFSATLTDKSPPVTFNFPRTARVRTGGVVDSLVERVTALGFPKDFTVKSVTSRAMNHAAATYFLLQSCAY
jgi:serine/threonine protein kinase